MRKTVEVINKMQADAVIGKYAIGGAVAATFYLEPSATLDIDVFVSLEKSAGSLLLSLSPVYEYLTAQGYQTQGEHVVIDDWPVQFLPPCDELAEEALAEAFKTEVEGVRTWVMTAEHLVALALHVGRPKDHLRIIQFIESGTLDTDRLENILARFDLLVKWERFEHKFLEAEQ